MCISQFAYSFIYGRSSPRMLLVYSSLGQLQTGYDEDPRAGSLVDICFKILSVKMPKTATHRLNDKALSNCNKLLKPPYKGPVPFCITRSNDSS